MSVSRRMYHMGWQSAHRDPAIIHAADKQDWTTVQQLTAHNAPLLDAVGRGHQTALHVAVNNMCFQEVPLLVSARNVDVCDVYGQTPLHLAMYGLPNVPADVVSRLATRHNVTVQDYCGQTPLHVALDTAAGISKFQVASLRPVLPLVRSERGLDLADNYGRTPLHLAMLLQLEEEEEEGGIVDALFSQLLTTNNIAMQDRSGKTALHLFLEKAWDADIPMELFFCLLCPGSQNAADVAGRTALHTALLASWHGGRAVPPTILHPLISAHNVNLPDRSSNTPLTYAITSAAAARRPPQQHEAATVRTLLSYGASCNMATNVRFRFLIDTAHGIYSHPVYEGLILANTPLLQYVANTIVQPADRQLSAGVCEMLAAHSEVHWIIQCLLKILHPASLVNGGYISKDGFITALRVLVRHLVPVSVTEFSLSVKPPSSLHHSGDLHLHMALNGRLMHAALQFTQASLAPLMDVIATLFRSVCSSFAFQQNHLLASEVSGEVEDIVMVKLLALENLAAEVAPLQTLAAQAVRVNMASLAAADYAGLPLPAAVKARVTMHHLQQVIEQYVTATFQHNFTAKS